MVFLVFGRRPHHPPSDVQQERCLANSSSKRPIQNAAAQGTTAVQAQCHDHLHSNLTSDLLFFFCVRAYSSYNNECNLLSSSLAYHGAPFLFGNDIEMRVYVVGQIQLVLHFGRSRVRSEFGRTCIRATRLTHFITVMRPSLPPPTTTMTKRYRPLQMDAHWATPPRKVKPKMIIILALLSSLQLYLISPTLFRSASQLPLHAEHSLARCASLKISAGPPANFHDRSESDRFVAGTKATLLHNAHIWTGENNGTEILHGDVFIDKGIIQGVGNIDLRAFGLDVDSMVARGELNVVDVHGAWLTPGCVSPGFDVRLCSCH